MTTKTLAQLEAEQERQRLQLTFDQAWRGYRDTEEPDMLLMEREYKFALPEFKYRADFAYLPAMVIVECDGGVYKQGGGGHNRGAAYEADRRRDLEAMIRGWLVIRLSTTLVEKELGVIIPKIVTIIKRRMKSCLKEF